MKVQPIAPFLGWCSSQGIQSPLDVKARENGSRYVVLKDQIETKDGKANLIRCPDKASISAPSLPELADRLMFEKNQGEKSMYAPYIAVLPEDCLNMPRFWDSTRFDQVADGGALHLAVKEDQARVDKASDPWALAIVDSRANFLPDNTYALTPLLDMINHKASIKTTAEVLDNELYLNIAAESIPQKPGLFDMFQPEPEVFISYGDFTNLQTLVQYGFSVEENPFNAESIKISVMRQGSITATVFGNGSVDPLSMSTLRQTLATTDELEAINEGDLMVPFLTNRNEMEVYALIAGYLEEAIYESKMGASTDDDVVASYLRGRVATLQVGMDKIRKKYPDLF